MERSAGWDAIWDELTVDALPGPFGIPTFLVTADGSDFAFGRHAQVADSSHRMAYLVIQVVDGEIRPCEIPEGDEFEEAREYVEEEEKYLLRGSVSRAPWVKGESEELRPLSSFVDLEKNEHFYQHTIYSLLNEADELAFDDKILMVLHWLDAYLNRERMGGGWWE